MAALFQTVLMRLALCGLTASLVLFALQSRIARDTFARLLSIWRSLTVFGRFAVCSFLLIGILIGGDKTNNVPPNMNSPLPQMQHGGVFLTGFTGLTGLSGALLHTPSSLNPVNLVNPVQNNFAQRKAANWNVRGAWKDSFWLPFDDGWVFPWGTNHLSGVEVISYGQVLATPFDTNAVASADTPFEIVRGLTSFAYELTPSNSYRFVWTDATINRDTNNLVTAVLELFRNGDVSVMTNGVAAYLPRVLPFAHNGFGQDAEWVTANFTNATEILAVGYPQWVDQQVGVGLTNGLYKLTVSVSLICPVETNAVVDISWEGSDGALFWSDAAATQPLSSLSGISLSSVTEESGGASYTFYMTSPNIGSGSFTATFTLPSGETRGVAKSYRAIEPIRKLVCSEIDPEYSCVFNPSRLVYGHPARLKVGINGNFSPSDVEWNIVSGPGTVTQGEDDFGEADWTATVTATAESGEVVVEARFNEDAIQPRFVLPIVQQRTLPVKAFVVNENDRPIASAGSIQSKIDYANVIFSQIGIQLSLLSISNDVGTAADLTLPKEQLYTNASGRAYWARSEQATALLNTYSEGDCIELYFVKEITGAHDSDPAAYKSPLGIVISKNSSDHVVAHEIGHALGMEDCYIANKRFSPPINIAGMGDPVSSQMFDDKGHDWGLESGRGFYPAHETIATTLPQMVMYGVDAGDSHDIPSGSVYSLRRNANASNRTFSSKVGANFIKVDITEVYSR